MRRIQSGSTPGTNPCRATSSDRHSPTQRGPSANPQSTSDNASIHASMIKEDPDGFLIVDQDIYRRLSERGSSMGATGADHIPSPPRDYSGVRNLETPMNRIQLKSGHGILPSRFPRRPSANDNASIHASMIKEDPNGFLIVNQDAYSRLSQSSSSSSRAPSPPRDYHGVRKKKSGSWVAEFRHPNRQAEKIWVGTFETKEHAAEAVARAKKELGLPLKYPTEK